MRLLDKYNRINIAVTIITMLVTGIIYYHTINSVLTNQIDKGLALEESEISNYAALHHQLPNVYENNQQQTVFMPLGKKLIERRFLDTIYKRVKDNHLETGRALISSVKIYGQYYRVLVIQSKIKTEHLIKIILLITLGVIIILLIILITINRAILKGIWEPFYKVLLQLKEFNLANNNTIKSVVSGVDEFKELDTAVITMADRVKNDYQNLKVFTKNASNKLMAPISLINSKLDTLLKTDEFTVKQRKLLNDIYATITKLTRLNESILLLAKIESGLIRDDDEVNVKEILEECLSQHEEMIQKLNINIYIELQDSRFKASKLLMEVLLSNLIDNAIKHNRNYGDMIVLLQPEKLIIGNSGAGPFDFDQALVSFHKSDEYEGGGLGLTLCKQICDNYGFKLEYSYFNDTHTFTVMF